MQHAEHFVVVHENTLAAHKAIFFLAAKRAANPFRGGVAARRGANSSRSLASHKSSLRSCERFLQTVNHFSDVALGEWFKQAAGERSDTADNIRLAAPGDFVP